MARVLLVYDITDDRIRFKIADACKDYGLDRLQLSTFTGELSRNHQDELMLKIASLLDDSPYNVQLIPIAPRDWDSRREMTRA